MPKRLARLHICTDHSAEADFGDRPCRARCGAVRSNYHLLSAISKARCSSSLCQELWHSGQPMRDSRCRFGAAEATAAAWVQNRPLSAAGRRGCAAPHYSSLLTAASAPSMALESVPWRCSPAVAPQHFSLEQESRGTRTK